MKSEIKNYIKNIFSLSIPIIIENILQCLLGTTDTYFAGTLSDHAIAGIGVTNLIMNLFLSFFTAVSVGASVIVARNYGRKDFQKVNRSVLHALVLGGVLGLGAGMICGFLAKPLLGLSGADDSVIRLALPYYLATTVPCIFLSLQLLLSGCLRAMKNTKAPMYVTGASNLLNIFLNFFFLKLGLGILGLGLATTFSRAAGALLLFLQLQNQDKNRKLTLCPFSKQEFASILAVGIPAGLEKLIMRIGQLLYNSMILSLGTASYVAHNIAGTIENYSYIPAMGFGLAVCTLVGVSLGENDVPKARKQTAAAYGISVCCMTVLGAVFFIFAPQFAGLFTNTEEVRRLVVSVLRLIAFFQPFTALVQIFTNALQGAGDTKFPMYATFVGIWGIRIGVGYFLAVPLGYGLPGVWWAYALDVAIRGSLLLFRFWKGKWQNISL